MTPKQLEEITSKLCCIAEKLDAISTEPDMTVQGALVPTPFCDPDTGDITGYIAWYLDDSQTPTEVYFDSDLDVTTVAPTGAPCNEDTVCDPLNNSGLVTDISQFN